MSEPGRDFATPDDPVLCHLCGKDTSIAMIAYHLEKEHGIDPEEIANAPVIEETFERRQTSRGETEDAE